MTDDDELREQVDEVYEETVSKPKLLHHHFTDNRPKGMTMHFDGGDIALVAVIGWYRSTEEANAAANALGWLYDEKVAW